MMTPRGVADVNVYTPERVELRYGVRPDQVPDFIGLKGDTSDNIPGIPGIGDKTAGQLIAQYGSLEAVIEHADELSPARGKAVREHAEQARDSKLLATMRRDLPLDVDPAELVSAPPDRSTAEGDLPALRVPRAARPGRHARRGAAGGGAAARRGPTVAWREGGARAARRGRSRRRAATDGRRRGRRRDGVVVVGAALRDLAPRLRDAASSSRTTRSPCASVARRPTTRCSPRTSSIPAAPATSSTTSPPSTASSSCRSRRPRRRRPRRSSATPRRPAGSRRCCARRLRERGSEPLYDEIELPLTAVLAAMEDAGVRIDTYRMGEITARLAERVEELEAQAHRARRRGVPARLDASRSRGSCSRSSG